jgi:plastocyanin
MKKLIVAAAIILLVGVGVWFLLSRESPDNSTTIPENPNPPAQPQSTEAQNQTQSPTPPATELSTESAKITYVTSGFQTSTLTIKAGQSVEIVNQSSQALYFASDPHPAHTQNPELNIGTINPGETKQFMPSAKGTWGYHNHLSANHTGKLIVE